MFDALSRNTRLRKPAYSWKSRSNIRTSTSDRDTHTRKEAASLPSASQPLFLSSIETRDPSLRLRLVAKKPQPRSSKDRRKSSDEVNEHSPFTQQRLRNWLRPNLCANFKRFNRKSFSRRSAPGPITD